MNEQFVMQTPPEFYLGEWPQYNRDARVRETLLQLPTEVLQGGYVPQWIVVPGSADKSIGARGNFRSSLQVIPGSILVGVRTYSSDATNLFSLTAYEVTSGRYISPRPVLSKLFGGSQNGLAASTSFTARAAFAYLESPWIVLAEGQITIEITNLSTDTATCQILLLFAVPRGTVGALAELAALTQRVLGDNPVRSAQTDQQGLSSPPWVTPPDGYQSFDYASAITTPAFGAGDTVIVSFSVPLGMNGIIRRLANDYAGPGFVDGSGDLIWRILIDGRAVQGYSAITVRLGAINQPTVIDGIQVSSGQLVSLVVNNATAALPVAGTQVTGRLGGYFYPWQT
jgi:hypothetical protein